MGPRGWLVLLVLAAVAGGWWRLGGSSGASDPSTDPVERAEPDEATRPVLTPAPGAPREAAAANAPPTAPATTPKPARVPLEWTIASVPQETGRLEGVVRDADGNPVAGATVRVMRKPTPEEANPERKPGESGPALVWWVPLTRVHIDADGNVAAWVQTDAAGRFAVDGVPLGVGLWVEASYASTWAEALDRLGGPLDVTLPRTYTVRGRVLDAATGVRLEGLRVQARPQAGSGVSHEARTDAEGTFELKGLTAGEYTVEAKPMRRRTDSLGLDGELPPKGLEAQPLARVTVGAQQSESLELRVWSGFTIAGRVEGPDARPPAGRVGIQVYARSAGGQPDQRRRADAWTAEDGTFVIDALPAGAYELFFVPPPDAAGAAEACSTWLHAVEAPAADLRVALLRGAAVRGRLLDEQDRPITDKKAMVYVREASAGLGAAGSMYATPDGTGAFATPPVPTGRAYALFVRVPGFAQADVAEVFPGTEVVVRLRSARQIRGQVRTPDGIVAGAQIRVVAWAESGDLRLPGAGATGYTDVRGQFVIDGLTGERYRVAAGGGGGAHAASEPLRGVAPGGDPLDLTLTAGVSISGRLVDPRGGPVQTQTLQSSGLSANLADLGFTRVDDREGRFLLSGLKPGKVHLLIYRDGKSVDLGQVTAPAKDLELVVPDP